MRFYILGDTQINNVEQELRTQKKILDLHKVVQKGDVLLIPGDLTNDGSNTHFINKAFEKLKSCFNLSNVTNFDDQLSIFIKNVYNPMYKLFDGQVFICHGNHDEIAYPIKPVLNFVRKKHGATYYTKQLNNNITLICLGKTFNKNRKLFLENSLKLNKDKQIIIMQHYNFIGPYSDFWSNKDKQIFFNIIEDYKKNILFIAHGHLHITSSDKINGFTFINGAGDSNISFEIV